MRESKTPDSRTRGMAGLVAPVLAVCVVVLLGACAQERPLGATDYVQDEHFAISDPGGRNATATGIGCALTARQALTEAQRAAHYNLRGVMGPGRYRVRYETMRDYREGARFCAEVEARVRY